MFTLRKPESEAIYLEAKKSASGCPLCGREGIHECEYWKLMPNTYPYDAVAEKHDMLVFKHHEQNASKEALEELEAIKKMKFIADYHCLIENFPIRQSVPGHFHVHLIRYIP